MTSKKTNNPMKDYVLNEYTGRLIKRGSKTYKRLVSAKLLDEDIPSTPEQNLILEADTPEQAKVLQAKMNKNIEKNKVITRRGTKVLKAYRRPKRQEIVDKVSDYAVDSVREAKQQMMEQDMTDDQMDDYIRNLIQRKLVGQDTKAKEPPVARREIQRKQIRTRQPVEEQEVGDYYEEDRDYE